MNIDALKNKFSKAAPEEILAFFLKEYNGKIALASSLGAEDQVLTDMICGLNKNTKIFTLDTGRLFPETYDLIERTNTHYKINIEVYFPDAARIERMVTERGINLFYESLENRKFCCQVRKQESLMRAFKNLEVWICGLRRDQSITRFSTPVVEWDNANELIKVNPLFDWNEEQVWTYIREHKVPYNALHDHGFPSIGCQPCTRAVKPGEDVRAGRWWWEEKENKECGLHKG